MKKKIFYCIVGGQMFAVLEDNIIERNDMKIIAKEVFTVGVSITPGPGGQMHQMVQIGTMKEAAMNCDFISELTEESSLYRAIKGKMSGLSLVE